MDDDGETIAVLGAGRIAALNTTALAWQAEVRRGAELKTSALLVHRSAFQTETKTKTCWLVCVSLLQEPPEDEANIIEKIISVRTKNKEVRTKCTSLAHFSTCTVRAPFDKSVVPILTAVTQVQRSHS